MLPTLHFQSRSCRNSQLFSYVPQSLYAVEMWLQMCWAWRIQTKKVKQNGTKICDNYSFLLEVVCQAPGNAICYLPEFDIIVDDPCCANSACLPYPFGYPAEQNNFCQFIARIAQDGDCSVQKNHSDFLLHIQSSGQERCVRWRLPMWWIHLYHRYRTSWVFDNLATLSLFKKLTVPWLEPRALSLALTALAAALPVTPACLPTTTPARTSSLARTAAPCPVRIATPLVLGRVAVRLIKLASYWETFPINVPQLLDRYFLIQWMTNHGIVWLFYKEAM